VGHQEGLLINICFVFVCRYPDYEFISDNSISWSAGLHNRYTENSLRGVILDIHFLSRTNFLVCTFSSQVKSDPLLIEVFVPFVLSADFVVSSEMVSGNKKSFKSKLLLSTKNLVYLFWPGIAHLRQIHTVKFLAVKINDIN